MPQQKGRIAAPGALHHLIVRVIERTRSVFDRYDIANEADLQASALKQQVYLESQNTGTISGIIDKKRGTQFA
jgi:hypothetical protein